MTRQHRRYIWFLIEFPNGEQKWYCVSKVLRQALFLESQTNREWKNTMIGNYITVSTREYINGHAPLTVGKVKKINISSHRGSNWTRNQFVTPEHLLDFRGAYNYLKHDYLSYNRFAIWVALRYWHNELKRTQIRKKQRQIRRIRWNLKKIAKKATKKSQ